MEKPNLIYQTDKFIIKCDEKNSKWYVSLMNKETEKVIIKFKPSERSAKKYFGRIMGWDVKKLNKLKAA